MSGTHTRLQIAVLLAVFAAPKGRPPTSSDIVRKMQPFLELTDGPAGAKTKVLRALEHAQADGTLERASSETAPAKAERYSLTADGDRLLRERFAQLRPGTWPVLRDKYLMPLAGNVADHNIPRGFGATRAAILAEALGMGERVNGAKSEAQILNRALAGLVGARTEAMAAIKTAVVRTWLQDSAKGEQSFDVDAFVQAVQGAANDVARQDGTPKAFINRVWARLQALTRTFGLDADQYREALLNAHRGGLLRLSVAALGPSYDEADMVASELHWRSEIFHFIEVD